MLKADDVDRLRGSLTRLLPDAGPVVDLFYMRLFAIAPGARDLFPDDMSAQNDKFRGMLAELIGLLDEPGRFAERVAELGQRHREYGAEPRHYKLVEEALIWALARELGPAFTADVESAWKSFYRTLAGRMIVAGEG